MKRTLVAILVLLAAPQFSMAEESSSRSPAVCKSITSGPDKLDLTALSEDALQEKMCLSALSVVRSADSMATMECRLAYRELTKEFNRRHPGKDMVEVYGRC